MPAKRRIEATLKQMAPQMVDPVFALRTLVKK
jgi:hypothetical protein